MFKMTNKKIITAMVFMVSLLSATTYGILNANNDVQANLKTTKSDKNKQTKNMNFNQIKAGNFQSIKGNWQQVASYSPKRTSNELQIGGDDKLNVTGSEISGAGIKMDGSSLEDSAGSHDLVFKKMNNEMEASIKDDDTAINYTVTFYPKGSTTEFQNDNKKNDKNLIAIWTSNNNYTEVFAQDNGAKKSAKLISSKKKVAKSSLNLSQISNNDFSSLVGKWTNSDGKSIDITGQTESPASDSSVAATKGAVVAGIKHDGYPEVVSGSSQINNGVMQGSIGTFDPNTPSLDPLSIVPNGQKVADNDDSNVNKDRLIVGGGQGGFAQQAYYRD